MQRMMLPLQTRQVPRLAVLAVAVAIGACETIEKSTSAVGETLGIDARSVVPDEGTVLENYEPSGFDYGAITRDREKSLALVRGQGRGLLHAPALSSYVNGVLARILEVAPEPGIPARAYIVDSGSINASATPSGEIFLPLGLLSNLDTEDELAFVLAHELSHIIFRHHESDWLVEAESHALEGIAVGYDIMGSSDPLQSSAPVQSAEAQDSLSEFMVIGEASLLLSEDVIAPSWTRGQEDEADLLGLDMVAEAGYSIDPIFTLLGKLAAAQAQLEQSKGTPRQRFARHLSVQLGTPGMEDHIATAITEASSALKRAFGRAHRTPEERNEFLLEYSLRYLEPPPQPVPVAWSTKGPRPAEDAYNRDAILAVFDHYAAASEALTALRESRLDKAVALAGDAVSEPTRHATFPRLVFHDIRERQGRIQNARENLNLAMRGEEVALLTYFKAIEYPRRRGDWQGALGLVEEARARLGDPPQLLPLRIELYRRLGRNREADQLVLKCRLEYPGALARACERGQQGASTGQSGRPGTVG